MSLSPESSEGAPRRRRDDGKALSQPGEGYGPLLQRDYWARIGRTELAASDVGELLARDFLRFPPRRLARFSRVANRSRPLEVGEELSVTIRLAGRFRVRVLHRDENSLTLGTVRGHPEAGRITFGAYRHEGGALLFHIRSWARSSSPAVYAGFLTLGTSMQANTWAGFIERFAAAVGGEISGFVHEETRQIDDGVLGDERGPTYVAKGD